MVDSKKLLPVFLAASLWAAPVYADRPASSAADVQSPPAAVSVIRGRIERAVLIELEPATRFALVEIGSSSGGTPPSQLPSHTKLVPFDASLCTHVYAALRSDDTELSSLIAGLRGQSVDGLVIASPASDRGTDPAKPLAWCVVLDGHASIVPRASAYPLQTYWTDVGKRRKESVLPALGAARDFFGLTDALPDRGLDATPVDGAIHSALKEMVGPASLDFALERRMYFFAEYSHYRYKRQPENFARVEKELFERPWRTRVPDLSLAKLYWRLSPTRAKASIVSLYEREPDKAMTILTSSPKWDEVLDAQLELMARDPERWRSATLGDFGHDGNERVVEHMRKELPNLPSDSPFAESVRERIALIDRRPTLGVTDGVTLARYLWAHRDDAHGYDSPFTGMRVSLTGSSTGCCDVEGDLGGGVKLEVRVGCDAETFKKMCDAPRESIVTVTGTLTSKFVSSPSEGRAGYVRLELEQAHAEVGGTLPPAPSPDVEPESPEPGGRPQRAFGCLCAHTADLAFSDDRRGSILAAIGLSLVCVRRRRRRA